MPVIDGASPNEIRDPQIREEIKRAFVWLGMASGIALLVLAVGGLIWMRKMAAAKPAQA